MNAAEMTYGHGQRIGLHVLAEKTARSQRHHVGQQALVMKEMSLCAESLAPWLQKVLGDHGHGKTHIRAVKNLGNAITVNLGHIMALTDQEAFTITRATPPEWQRVRKFSMISRLVR